MTKNIFLEKTVANVSNLVAEKKANTACFRIFHQDVVSDKVIRLKR